MQGPETETEIGSDRGLGDHPSEERYTDTVEEEEEDAGAREKQQSLDFKRLGMDKIEEMERRIQEEQAMLKARLEARKKGPSSTAQAANNLRAPEQVSCRTGSSDQSSYTPEVRRHYQPKE